MTNYKKYDVYIGLKDRDTYNETETLDDIAVRLSKAFCKSEMGFSLTAQLGGYIHEDGTYIIENSMRITVIGAINQKELDLFIETVKSVLNQETVLVVITDVKTEYLKD